MFLRFRREFSLQSYWKLKQQLPSFSHPLMCVTSCSFAPQNDPPRCSDPKTHGSFSNDENNRNQRVSLVFSAGAKSSVQVYKNRPVSILQRKKNAFYNGNPLALALGVARGLLSTFYMTYQVKIVVSHANYH